ncbi:MAG: hypothetical protein HY568_03505 [Candidatus Latescibacteria bacterium]|nr:hypothetical protein [Candidatus Latescibacterota bacterium]
MLGFRDARASAGEALRGFRWLEYRPFAWIMAIQLLFLVCASNLGTAWGMASAGWLLRLVRETGVHYPTSFVALPVASSYLDSFLFVCLGSFLIPLSLARIVAHMEGSSQRGPLAVRRAWNAVPATLCSLLLNIGVLLAWQWIYLHGPSRLIRGALPGFGGAFTGWLLSELISFAVGAVFVYVPVRAVAVGARLPDAVLGGLREGLRMFGPTLVVIVLLSWPVMILLVPVQLGTQTIVSKFRPELVAVGLGAVAVLNSFLNYVIYSSVARLRRLGATEAEP